MSRSPIDVPRRMIEPVSAAEIDATSAPVSSVATCAAASVRGPEVPDPDREALQPLRVR